MSYAQIPCDKEHRNKFKQIACNEQMSMKDLFHKWVDAHPTRLVIRKVDGE